MQAQGLTVGMVGDSINDAPALAKAQIGFAMVAQGPAAIETADVYLLMDDDLHKVATFVRLSRITAINRTPSPGTWHQGYLPGHNHHRRRHYVDGCVRC